jgi:23S rRNA pseudouridine1911/1915/1917 synthase
MKHIPFYPNQPDNAHAQAAVYQMLLDYYLNRKLSVGEVESFLGSAEGRAVWPLKPLITMARQGFDIRMIIPFDFARYAEQGQAYLEEQYSSDAAEWLVQHSNILDITEYIREFLRTVKPEVRRANLKDIDTMLSEDRLVALTYDAPTTSNKKNHTMHSLLILQREGEKYIVHDPGLPAQSYRRLTRHQLWEMIGGDQHMAEVTGIIYRDAHIKRRLDQYVLTQKPRLSRAFSAKLIEQGKVLVNGTVRKPGYKVRDDDTIAIDYDDAALDIIPDITLPIIYEDDDVVVINKPAGVLTHSQGALLPEATVATFLRDRVVDMQGERAGIVHRLDRATSGIIIGAKHQTALRMLQKQFADRLAKKTYVAIVQGQPAQPEAVISMPIERNPKAPATFRVGPNGKPAVTRYKVVQHNSQVSMVELLPQTGRTHQLRVHMAEVGHPIIGDPLYGSGSYGDRLYLHAQQLHIALPNGEEHTFTAPLPPEFQEYMAQ